MVSFPWISEAPGQTGDGSIDPDTGCFSVTGSGADVWGTSDQFHYVYVEMTEEKLMLEATLTSHTSTGTNEWSKAGLMMRDSCAAGSAFQGIIARMDGHIHKQYRLAGNGDCGGEDNDTAGQAYPIKFRLVKVGADVTGYYAFYNAASETWGAWNSTGTHALADEDGTGAYLVGAYVTAHDNAQLSTAEFCDVVIAPVNEPTVSIAAEVTEQDLCEGMVSFAVTATTADPDGDNVTVQWSAPAGIVFDYPNGIMEPNVLSQSAGEFVITCTASDGVFTVTDQIILTVNPCPNEAPTVSLAVDADTADLCADSVAFTFTATADDPDGNDTITLAWEVTDAVNPDAITLEVTDNTCVATATDVGAFTVQVTVTDNYDETASDSVEVTVNACPGETVYTG